MDAKLLKEFEEMEGLSNETLVDPEWQTEKDQDDFDIKAVNASAMTSADVFYEVSFSCFVYKSKQFLDVVPFFLLLYTRWRNVD
jgi:hypothetical protein